MQEFLNFIDSLETQAWYFYNDASCGYIPTFGRLLRDVIEELREDLQKEEISDSLESLEPREWDNELALSLKKSLVLMYREAKKKEEN